MPRIPILAAALLLPLASCTTQEVTTGASAASAERQCFFPSQITGYTNAGNNQIYVHTGPNDVYLFQTWQGCHDLNWAQAIGVDQIGPGQICNGLDVTLVVPSATGTQRCPVRMIRKLQRHEAARL